MEIYTIGHSTRSLEDFIGVLKHYKINLLVDVRRFPGSNKFPWFNKENLEAALPKEGIEYVHFEKLHGFRKEGYEAFASSQEFKKAISELENLVKGKIAAVMCAEIIVYKCHRRYISRELAERGNDVIHIVDKEKIIEDKFAAARKPKIRCE